MFIAKNMGNRQSHKEKQKVSQRGLPRPNDSLINQRLNFLLDHSEPPVEVQQSNGWNGADCSRNIVVKEQSLSLHRQPVAQSTDCARGKKGYQCGMHVWEVQWKVNQRGTHASIGVGTKDAALHCFGYCSLTGNDHQSWGWDIGKSRLCHKPGPPAESNGNGNANGNANSNCYMPSYPSWLEPDEHYVVPESFLMILDMDSATLSFYTTDWLGVAFSNLPRDKKLYPMVSCVWGHCEVGLRYKGSLLPEPLPLIYLCRQTLRDTLGREEIQNKVNQLNIPYSLRGFLCSKPRFDKPPTKCETDDRRNHNDQEYRQGDHEAANAAGGISIDLPELPAAEVAYAAPVEHQQAAHNLVAAVSAQLAVHVAPPARQCPSQQRPSHSAVVCSPAPTPMDVDGE